MIGRAILATSALIASGAHAAEIRVPIQWVQTASGAIRYTIQLTIDGQPATAGLDTGSSGLRVLARGLPPSRGGPPTQYGFGSGLRLQGVIERHQVSIGGLSAAVPLMRVSGIGCAPRLPRCFGASANPATYGLQGDGIPGQGFVALVGTGLVVDPVGNPLPLLSARQWIVALPRDQAHPGVLLLNPAPERLAAYRRIALKPGTNNFDTCLIATTRTPICGESHFDSGAPGLRIIASRPPSPWPRGTRVTAAIGSRDPRAPGVASLPVTIGDRAAGGGMIAVSRPGRDGTLISLGNAPYLFWSVLYDSARHEIGVGAPIAEGSP